MRANQVKKIGHLEIQHQINIKLCIQKDFNVTVVEYQTKLKKEKNKVLTTVVCYFQLNRNWNCQWLFSQTKTGEADNRAGHLMHAYTVISACLLFGSGELKTMGKTEGWQKKKGLTVLL